MTRPRCRVRPFQPLVSLRYPPYHRIGERERGITGEMPQLREGPAVPELREPRAVTQPPLLPGRRAVPLDPDRGVEFSTYATHTGVGELKRHFRDKGWAVRAPRRMQELYLRLGKVIATLSQDLGRSPTIPELAAEAQVSEEEVLEALEAGQAYRFASLDAPSPGEDES